MGSEMKVAVAGAGAWGTAVALHCQRQGVSVTLAPRRLDQAIELQRDRENRSYLPGFEFGDSLAVEADLSVALSGADVVFLAAPSYALRGWCERILASGIGEAGGDVLFLSLAKGLEVSTGLTPCGIIAEALPGACIGSLAGPTFAGEVAAGRPTAMTLAFEGDCAARALELQGRFSGPNLRVYASSDLPGVELGGCLKNVYAVAAGCCQGLGLGDNALAALLTRAVAEMVRVGVALGARAETFYGLSGFGDLAATCHGGWSRNRGFGEAIASGRNAAEIVSSQRTAVEGYRTAKAFRELCVKRGIEAPILEQVYRICYEGKAPIGALGDLMGRDLKSE